MQSWASFTAGEPQAGSDTTISRTTSVEMADKNNSRQLVIDVSRVGEGTAEVATTDTAKQATQQGIQQGKDGVEHLNTLYRFNRGLAFCH